MPYLMRILAQPTDVGSSIDHTLQIIAQVRGDVNDFGISAWSKFLFSEGSRVDS